MAPETHRAIDAVWRIESAWNMAGLTKIERDVGPAKVLAKDALVTALERMVANALRIDVEADSQAADAHVGSTSSEREAK